MTNAERRKYPRTPLAVMLEIFQEKNKRIVGKGFITNISEEGLAVETREKLHPGEKFMLRFTLPNSWTFDINGEIMYERKGVLSNAYGIKLFHDAVETREKLKNYVIARIKE